MSTQKIYFMDFIRDNFKDLKILEKIFIKNLYRRGYTPKAIIKDYKNVFEMIYLQDKQTDEFRNIFSAYVIWSESYNELGFLTSTNLSQVHYKWQSLIRENASEDILFEKVNYIPLQIKFEGE